MNLSSGMNFMLTRLAKIPRKKRLASRGGSTASVRRVAERHHIDRGELEVGRHAHFGQGERGLSSTSSMISPRAKISASACRIISPTFS